MKKWKQILTLTALTLGVVFAAKTNVSAETQITGVKQTDAGTKNVKISWNAALGCERYVTEMSEDMVNWYTMDDCSGTETNITGLSSGHTYYVRVTGYKDWSWITDKGTLAYQASVPVDVVTAPEVNDFSVTQENATTSNFSIKFPDCSSSGANYYQVYLSGQDTTPIGESSSTTVTMNQTFSKASEYWCSSYACRKSSAGFVAKGTRSYDSFKTLSGTLSKGQFGIRNAWYNLNSYQFGVLSETVGAYDGVQVQFQTPAGKSKKTITNTSSYVSVDSFINGSFYKYRVRTFVNCGTKKAYSGWSAFRYVGVTAKVSANGTSGALKFSWSKVANASGYVVYMSTSENSGYQKVKTTNASNRSVSLKKFKGKKLQKNKKYYVRIYAKAKDGKNTVTSEVCWSGYYYRY